MRLLDGSPQTTRTFDGVAVIAYTPPNAANQWRAATDASHKTETQSARPLNLHC
jgi:hypothetical protein